MTVYCIKKIFFYDESGLWTENLYNVTNSFAIKPKWQWNQFVLDNEPLYNTKLTHCRAGQHNDLIHRLHYDIYFYLKQLNETYSNILTLRTLKFGIGGLWFIWKIATVCSCTLLFLFPYCHAALLTEQCLDDQIAVYTCMTNILCIIKLTLCNIHWNRNV